jgi:hypothetical protein
VARALLLEDQVTVGLEAFSGMTFAFSVSEVPANSVAVLCETTMLSTGMSITVTSQVAVTPLIAASEASSACAVMVAVPAPTPVITPVNSPTVATAGAELSYFTLRSVVSVGVKEGVSSSVEPTPIVVEVLSRSMWVASTSLSSTMMAQMACALVYVIGEASMSNPSPVTVMTTEPGLTAVTTPL